MPAIFKHAPAKAWAGHPGGGTGLDSRLRIAGMTSWATATFVSFMHFMMEKSALPAHCSHLGETCGESLLAVRQIFSTSTRVPRSFWPGSPEIGIGCR